MFTDPLITVSNSSACFPSKRMQDSGKYIRVCLPFLTIFAAVLLCRRDSIRAAGQTPTAVDSPSGWTAQTKAGKARDPVGQAGDGSAAAEALGSPASLEQQKEEKRRTKEERRRQREETRGADKADPPVEGGAAAQAVASGKAELNEEDRRREEKRLRKEERRRKREAAPNGVKAGGGDESGLGGGISASAQGRGVPHGLSGEKEERRRAKEEKRRRKEERKKATELGGMSEAGVLPPVSPVLAEAASTKRQMEEVDTDQTRGQKRAKVDVTEVVGKRPREEENGLELGRSVGKKQKGEETLKLSAQSNGVAGGVPDEEAAGKEEKQRRKGEKRRAKEAAGAAEQPLGEAVGGDGKGTGAKRKMEDGPVNEAMQASEKQRQLGEEKGTGKRTEAQMDGLEVRAGISRKERKEGATVIAPTVVIDAPAGGKGEKGGKSKEEERKRQREAGSTLDAGQTKAGAMTKGAAADESKTFDSGVQSREQKRARKEQKKGKQSEASGVGDVAAVEQRLGSESKADKGQGKRKEQERGILPAVDGVAVEPPSNTDSVKKKKRKVETSR